MRAMKTRNTLVGRIDREVLAFTVGKDLTLDRLLVEADCLGTAAHVTMLARLPLRPPLLTAAQRTAVVAELVAIMRAARRGRFAIAAEDQDVHLAVERMLTRRLGDLGKRVHTARSRNDQAATDLRLYTRGELLEALDEALALAGVLLRLGRRHAAVPMVGRTHLQPAMPSSVGVWASAYAESLLDDVDLLRAAYELNNRSPLGSAAGYGVPLPIDRVLTARLLGFRGPVHNVLHAANLRGKCEAAVLAALGQAMITLSRLAEDLILFTMPEFGYFSLPPAFCTGSSIMPQKNNPDVLELVRARAAVVLGWGATAAAIVSRLPGGYQRDLQETKEPLIEGLRTIRSCLRILTPLLSALRVHRERLAAGFTPSVFATDRALELAAEGVPFRDAYRRVKEDLAGLRALDPRAALARKTHLGAPAGLDWAGLRRRMAAAARATGRERRRCQRALTALLGVRYPELEGKP